MPVTMVRNNQAGPTVLSSDPKGTHYVEWQGKGDPSGGDIQPVPDEIRETVAFSRCIRRGVLAIVEDGDESINEAMERQQASWNQRQQHTEQTAQEHIEQTTNNDIVTLPCVGPSTRGTGKCGTDVTVRDGQKNERPPLCSLHVDLAPQFIPEDVIADGKPTIQWTRLTLGARERQQ